MKRIIKQYWRKNNQIQAPEVRVIGADGKQLGVMATHKALREAIDAGLDLVEIAPFAKPPVAKIVDIGKFKYQEEKRLRKQKKKTKSTDLKEVRFSPFIGEADYNTRLTRMKEFLSEGHKIRAVVKFKGRQMGSKQFGYNLFKRLLDTLKDTVTIDMEPKFFGRHLGMVISPTKKAKELKQPNKKAGQKSKKPKGKTKKKFKTGNVKEKPSQDSAKKINKKTKNKIARPKQAKKIKKNAKTEN